VTFLGISAKLSARTATDRVCSAAEVSQILFTTDINDPTVFEDEQRSAIKTPAVWARIPRWWV